MLEKSDPTLHVYSQPDNYMEAWVVGNRAGLESLRAAIDKALSSHKLEGAPVFAADGEGYTLLVLPVSDPKALEDLKLPYYEFGPSSGGTHPYHLVTKDDYVTAVSKV